MGNSNTKERRPGQAPATPASASPTRSRDREKRRSRRKEAQEIRRDPSETVDGGFLFPQGVYTGPQDYKSATVRELIIYRCIAPFYVGLETCEPDWTDLQLLAAVKHRPFPAGADANFTNMPPEGGSAPRGGFLAPQQATTPASLGTEILGSPAGLSRLNPHDEMGVANANGASIANANGASEMTPSGSPRSVLNVEDKTECTGAHSLVTGLASLTVADNRAATQLSERDAQAVWLYRNVHECPICFLLYPRLNATQCCRQDICTECFVQIKRAPPHRPHGDSPTPNESAATDNAPEEELVSEPAFCPFCTKPNFILVFEAPPFEWGIPRPHKRPQPPLGPVMTDTIRPDWKSQLESARRRLARKSAAAQALHRTALLPADPSHRRSSSHVQSDAAPRRRRRSTLSDLISASRSMSAVQMRDLESRMVESAIQQSLREQ